MRQTIENEIKHASDGVVSGHTLVMRALKSARDNPEEIITVFNVLIDALEQRGVDVNRGDVVGGSS